MGKFSFDTVKDFDEHILASIPNYEEIHKCIDGMMEYFIKDGALICDIGCSTGSLLKRLDNNFRDTAISLIGYDTCKNLLPADLSGSRCEFVLADVLNDDIQVSDSDIVFSIFTLCFIPAFICVEKIYSTHPRIETIFNSLYYSYKRERFEDREILDKEESLREIQTPLSAAENINMFRNAGFDKIDSFWKYYQFEGWICLK